jgi:hypothetical protein
LHKHYATRDDLLRAVGHRAIDLLELAVTGAGGGQDPDGGLHALTAAMIPIGPQRPGDQAGPARGDADRRREPGPRDLP